MTHDRFILSVFVLPQVAHVVTSFEPCPDCRGVGHAVDELTPGVVMVDRCTTCEGTGVTPVLAEAVTLTD